MPATTAATTASHLVSALSGSTSAKATSASTAATASASHAAILPAVSGRSLVRLTCLSKSRSAQSLMAQPAERIRKVPATKIQNSPHAGGPPAAIHMAHSVGHSSSSVPIGLSMRTRRA